LSKGRQIVRQAQAEREGAQDYHPKITTDGRQVEANLEPKKRPALTPAVDEALLGFS
jgi:hypothetical protein